MFDRFTDNARKAMARSRKEALRLGHDSIGTEHILLALIAEKDCSAVKVLESLGVDLDSLQSKIAKLVKPGSVPDIGLQLPFTQRAREVLEQSMSEANELGHNYIGTEHLLLGLLRVKKDLASKALLAAGLKPEEVRDQLSMREADELHHNYIGTEHLLLGLLREKESLAARVLARLGITEEDCRREIPLVAGCWSKVAEAEAHLRKADTPENRRRHEEAVEAYHAFIQPTPRREARLE